MMQELCHLLTAIGLLLCFAESTGEDVNSLPGHLQNLGKHRPPEGHIEILEDLPSPQEFWEKYARDGVPVLFRGMAFNSLGPHRWTDDYLMEHYHDLRVRIEGKGEGQDYPEGVKGIGQDTIEYFLNTYKSDSSRNAYIVSQLPDPMANEVSVPPFMTCGTFSQRLLEANLWFSGGGTRSLLHADADNAINCLYFGTKDWIFIDPKYQHLIPVAEEETVVYGGYALLNPDRVDMVKFPKVAEVPWTYGNVTAGDCIFLPTGYWHQVRSYGSRNLAVSLLFSRLKENDLSDCEGATNSYKPLSEMEMVYTYNGYEEQTMGDRDPFELNQTIQERWCQHSNSLMSIQDIFSLLREEYSDMREEAKDEHNLRNAAFLQEVAEQIIQLLDANKDDQISCSEETQGLKLATLKKLANLIDRDPANTEVYEYAMFEPSQIRKFISNLITDYEGRGLHTISHEEFVMAYRDFGGSQKIGNEVYATMSPKEMETIAISHLKDQAENVSALFSPNMKHKTPIIQQLQKQERKRSIEGESGHDEL